MGSSHYVHKVDGLLSKLYEKDPARQGVFEVRDGAANAKSLLLLCLQEMGRKNYPVPAGTVGKEDNRET